MVLGTSQSPLAPRSRAARCTPVGGSDKRVFTVYLPPGPAGAAAAGDVVWVVHPGHKPDPPTPRPGSTTGASARPGGRHDPLAPRNRDRRHRHGPRGLPRPGAFAAAGGRRAASGASDAATSDDQADRAARAAAAATSPADKQQFTGTLRGGVIAIGAETTGWVLETANDGRVDVDVSKVATPPATSTASASASKGR
jgi:hypothetical protein